MKDAGEILKELLNESRQIVQFIDAHAYDYSISDSNLRATYATSLFYASIDLYRAVYLLTAEQLRGPAITLIRPILESWIKGTWVISVPPNDEIDRIAEDNNYWRPKKLWELAREVNETNEFLGGLMQNLLASVNPYLNACIHSNNAHLNRYFNKETRTIEPNIPDNEMAFMLDLANTLVLSSTLHMKVAHTEDIDLLRPFIDKLTTYQVYSHGLLDPLVRWLTDEGGICGEGLF